MILLFLEDAGPWLGGHLERIADRIDQGLAGASAFDTGLLDRDLYWYLEDMAAARGLQAGLQAAHRRMAGRWLDRVRNQALALRWAALLLEAAVVLGIGLWHYAALDELRRGWMMFHAGS